MWLVVLLGTLVGRLVFGSVASGSSAIGVFAISMIIGYFGIGRVVPNLKWILDISSE